MNWRKENKCSNQPKTIILLFSDVISKSFNKLGQDWKSINTNCVLKRRCEKSFMNNKNVELQEIWTYFHGEPHVFLATVDVDQPRVRPVTLIHFRDKLYVTTGSDDAKVKQIKQNAKTELCLLLEKGDRKGTIRAECITQIVEDKDVKSDVFHNISFAKEFWKSPEDPNYTVIELKPASFEYMKPGSIEAVKIKL